MQCLGRDELLDYLTPHLEPAGMGHALTPRQNVGVTLVLDREYYHTPITVDADWPISLADRAAIRLLARTDDGNTAVWLIPYACIRGVHVILYHGGRAVAPLDSTAPSRNKMVTQMNQEYWISEIRKHVVPSSDAELAARGIVQPKPGYMLTFLMPYASVTAFSNNRISLGDARCITILVPEYGHETIHRVLWTSIAGISISFDKSIKEDRADLVRQILLDDSQAQ